MDQVFVIDKFVSLGRLHMAVQDQAFAVMGGLDHFNLLIGGLFGGVDLGDTPHMGFVGGVEFDVPVGADFIGQNLSPSQLIAGKTARKAAV